MSAVHLDDLISWQNEAVLIGKLTQLGRPAELQDTETVNTTSDEKYQIIGVLQQETSVEVTSEVQDMNTDQLPYLSVASLLFFFHYPGNSLKDAGFSKDRDSNSISGSLLFNTVIAHKVLKESEYKIVLKLPACSFQWTLDELNYPK